MQIVFKEMSNFIQKNSVNKTSVRCFLIHQTGKYQKSNTHTVNCIGNSHSPTLLVGVQNGTIPVEGSLLVSNKSKYSFTL